MKDTLNNFFNGFSFILYFLVFTALLQVTTNSKITQVFLWLVLVSMLVANADKATNLMKGV